MTARFVSFAAISALCLLPLLVGAQGYVNLVGVPFVPENSQSLGPFITGLYRLAIGIAALAAVLRLILAGAKYIVTDVVTAKGEAKKDIQNALIGLLIVLSAVLILNTINPALNSFNALDGLQAPVINVNGPPPRNREVTIGDNVSRTSVDPEVFTAKCTSINGETVIYGDNISCVQPTTATSAEYQNFLSQTTLSDNEKQRIGDIYENLPNSADLNGQDFSDILTNQNPNALDHDHAEIFDTINDRYTAAEFTTIKNEFISQGRSDAAATNLAFEKILRDEAVFIQIPGGTQTIQNNRIEVCEAVDKNIYRTDTSSGSHLVCL